MDSKKYLAAFLNSIREGTKPDFLALSGPDPETVAALSSMGCKELRPPARDRRFQERFLREYVDLVGKIGAEQDSRLWWATDIASKNRFASRIPDLLNQFFTAAEATRSSSDLIVLDPPWQIVDSLVDFFKKNNRPFKVIGYENVKWRDILFSRTRRIASVLKTSAACIKKIIAARRACPLNLPGGKGSLYVIKSFIYDHSFSDNGKTYRDAFFGSLPDYLKEKKRLLIFADILGDYSKALDNISRHNAFSIIPVEKMLSIKDVIATAFEALLSRFEIIKNQYLYGEYEVSSIFRNEISRTFNGLAFYQMFHYRAVKNLLKAAEIDTFLLTYENNPWEKMCIQSLRTCSPDTKIIGYAHTVIPQACANMFTSPLESKTAPRPDLILTVGQVPKEIIERYGICENGRIKASCGLRFEYLFKLPVFERKLNGNIAVMLEGIPEVCKMVDYVLGELGNTRFKVRIRTHPVLQWDQIARNITRPWASLNNISFSESKSIKEDVEWADIVVYWGTTVALEALSMGTPVIHFDAGSVFSYDPLFECDHLKWNTSRGQSLSEVIQKIYSLNEESFKTEQQKAKEYLNRYFYPIDNEALGKFIFESVQVSAPLPIDR